MIKEVVADGAKLTPPATVSVLNMFEIPLSQWVLVMTAIYTLLMIIVTVRKLIFSHRASDKDPACAEDCPVAHRLAQEQSHRRKGK